MVRLLLVHIFHCQGGNMDEVKYNKQIGRIKCMVFKNDGEVYGFIEGNRNTNGKDYYFKPVKDEDLYLDRGDLVSFRPREYDDGKYSALNVTPLEKDTAFWNFLCSQNGESLYEKIKSSLGTRDLKRIWERIPVDQLLNHEWLLKDMEGPEAVSFLNSLIIKVPENHKELIQKLIAQNRETFKTLDIRKKYPEIIDYIEKSIPYDYLLEHEWLLRIMTPVKSASFLDSLVSEDPENHKELILKLIEQKRILFQKLTIKSKFQNIIDYILKNEEALEKIGSSLPEFITNNGLAVSGAIDLESIPRHLITEGVLDCFDYKKCILFLVEHDDLKNRYQDYFTNLIRNSSRIDDNLIFSLPEKVITKEVFQLFKIKDKVYYLLNHKEKLKECYEYFKSLAQDYKGELDVNLSIPLAVLKCFNFSQQKEYLFKKYDETNGLKEDPALLDHLKYLLANSTEIFTLDGLPEELITEGVVQKLPIYDMLSYYDDRIKECFNNAALKNEYLKKREKAIIEKINTIEAGKINPVYVTEPVFNAFNKNQKTEYVMNALLKVGEQDKTTDSEILLDRLSQCGDFKLEEIGNLSTDFLYDRRLLDALKKSHNEPAEKVRFIYQLVNSSKLSRELVDCLQPEEGSVYAPVHYLVRYSYTNDRKDFELMNKSFIELKKTTSNLLKENDYDTVAEELSLILPTCQNRAILDYGARYRYFCDAVFQKDRKTDSKQNASSSWCRGYRRFISHRDWVGGDVCPRNIPYGFDYTQWTIVDLFDAFKVRAVNVPRLKYPEDYIPKVCGTFNWLFKNRQLMECRYCHELMEEDRAYSKERIDKNDTDVFAAYINTVYGCKKALDENSKHDYKVYLNHCYVCGDDSTIDSRESHFQDIRNNRKFYLCMQCGSGGFIKLSENNYYYVTIPGTICPKCGSDNMKYIGKIKLEGVKQHVFQCNEENCQHKIGLSDQNFERFYPAGTLYVGEDLRGKGFIREGYELYENNILVKVYDSKLKRLVNVTPERND